MNRAVIYYNGTYDEGTGDELEARRNGRDPHMEHPIGPDVVLPPEWIEVKEAHNTPKSELIEALGDAGERARLGEIANAAKGTPEELTILLAIREQLDIHISHLQGR